MGAPNAARVEVRESRYTYTGRRLDDVLQELDMRVNSANCWVTITRTSGLISKIEYFANSGRTILACEQNITRGSGVGGVQLVTNIETIYYNSDTTEDSQVDSAVNRPGLGTDDNIVTCDSPFTTTEPQDC